MIDIHVVTFDVGQTLLHWWTYSPRRFTHLCRLAGLPVRSEHEVGAEIACAQFWTEHPPSNQSTTNPNWWRRHNLAGLRAAGLSGNEQHMLDLLDEAVATVGDRWVLDPDVPAVLDVLRKRGVRLAVVSNTNGGLLERLERHDLAHYFEYVADSAVLGTRKPDPRIYHEVCRRLGVSPTECMHVGDRVDADVAVARAVGAVPVLYDPLECGAGDHRRVTRLMHVVDLVGQGR